jgi:hypothetical protein
MTRKVELMPPAAVEESLGKLAALVTSFDSHAFSSSQERASQWRESVDATRWLAGIRRLFEATAKVVTQLQLGNPVVVLNHDGSEAVPQIVSLVQVLASSQIISCIFPNGFISRHSCVWIRTTEALPGSAS